MWEVKKTTSPLLLAVIEVLYELYQEKLFLDREKTWRTNYVLCPRSQIGFLKFGKKTLFVLNIVFFHLKSKRNKKIIDSSIKKVF
jgi:hypothetical protein